jgi:aromatic ring hydroxylase
MERAERLRLFHAVCGLSADTFGAYRSVGSLHGAGGLHAQRLVARKGYDIERAKAEVRRFLTDEPDFSMGVRSPEASTER